MFRLICSCFVVLFSFNVVEAQQVFFFAGPSVSKLYNIQIGSKNYITDFTNGYGYHAGYGISILNEDSIKMLASVRIDHSAGGFNYVKEFETERQTISGSFGKTTLGICAGAEPFKIMGLFETSAELQCNVRLQTTVSGYDVKHNDTLILSEVILQKENTRKFMSFGLAFSIAYPIHKKNNRELLLYYRLYTGLTNELKQVGTSMKLAQGSLGLMYRFEK